VGSRSSHPDENATESEEAVAEITQLQPSLTAFSWLDTIRSALLGTVGAIGSAASLGLSPEGAAVGSYLVAFGDQLIPTQRDVRLPQFLDALVRLEVSNKDRIDHLFRLTADYQAMVEEALRETLTYRSDGKRHRYAAALISSARFDRPSIDDCRRLMETLTTLRASHVDIIETIANLGARASIDGVHERLPRLTRNTVVREWTDLTIVWRLVEAADGPPVLPSDFEPTVATPEAIALALISGPGPTREEARLSSTLTADGRDFVEFIRYGFDN
jgi:hypothetical protein